MTLALLDEGMIDTDWNTHTYRLRAFLILGGVLEFTLSLDGCMHGMEWNGLGTGATQ